MHKQYSTCCSPKGRESRWSPLCAGHQAAQQPVGVQCLLQCAALRAGLAAEGGLPCARFQELGAEWRLGQRGGGRVPWASRQVAKGKSRGQFGCSCGRSSAQCHGKSKPCLFMSEETFFSLGAAGRPLSLCCCDNWSYCTHNSKISSLWVLQPALCPQLPLFTVSLPVYLYSPHVKAVCYIWNVHLWATTLNQLRDDVNDLNRGCSGIHVGV